MYYKPRGESALNLKLMRLMDEHYTHHCFKGAKRNRYYLYSYEKGFMYLVAISNDIKLSMNGKGRAIDNVFIERLWRSVKYESVYPNPPDSGIDLYKQLKDYFKYYNTQRRHQGIDNQIPFKRYLIKQQKAA